MYDLPKKCILKFLEYDLINIYQKCIATWINDVNTDRYG